MHGQHNGAAGGTTGLILNLGYCHTHRVFPLHTLYSQDRHRIISIHHSQWISSVGVFKAFSAQLTTNINERLETYSFVFINHGHAFLHFWGFLQLYGYVKEGDNSSGLEARFDKKKNICVAKKKKSSQFPSQSSHVIKSKSNKAAKQRFLLSVQQAPRALLFPFFRTSPLNIRRIVSQYVSVVIAQAIMRHRIGEGEGVGGCGNPPALGRFCDLKNEHPQMGQIGWQWCMNFGSISRK